MSVRLPVVYHPAYSAPLPAGHRFPMTKFQALYEFLLQTLPTWSRVPDWLDEKNLPAWTRGASAEPSERPR